MSDKKKFCRPLKDGKTGDIGEKQNGSIIDKDYLTDKKTWNEFNMKNMSDYHDYYFKKYVLLLNDIFEKLVDTCLKFYKLDPCHYFSSPWLG